MATLLQNRLDERAIGTKRKPNTSVIYNHDHFSQRTFNGLLFKICNTCQYIF